MALFKFKTRDLARNNPNVDNIRYVKAPYYWAMKDKEVGSGNMVIVAGTDFNNFPSRLDSRRFIDIQNQMLNYIRKECPNYKLYYRPHPSETDESSRLNLDGFEVMDNKDIIEVFLWKNAHKIKYFFSPCSFASSSAHFLGINSYVFIDIFRSFFGEDLYSFYMNYFNGMPDNFFIKNLDNPFKTNHRILEIDETLRSGLRAIMTTSKGKVWLITYDIGFMINAIGFANMIKEIDPQRDVNIVIARTKRWKKIDINEFRHYFKDIFEFPYYFFSLRPMRLLNAIGTWKKIKNLNLSPDDIIIGNAHSNFIENCFISIYKNNPKISFINSGVFELNYELKHSSVFNDKIFRFLMASVFYNKILEPLLGLNRTMFLQYEGGKIYNIDRYEKALNSIYDIVFVASIGK
jgi:hypothetical protein